jgi:hypothetical protein
VSEPWDDEERAIARALDAPDVEPGPIDARALDDYQAVLSHLPVEEITPPDELEDRVIAAALARRSADTVALEPGRAKRRRNRIRVGVLAAAAAAAVIVGVVFVANNATPDAEPDGRVALATTTRDDAEVIAATAGARVGSFGSGTGLVALGPDGRGAVYDLADGRRVGIGLVTDGETTAIGTAVPSNGVVAFSVDEPERVDAIALLIDDSEVARATLVPN